MFIIKFNTLEEKGAARIKLYNDEVFMFAFEEIRAINSLLSVEEIFCSADRMTDYLLEHNINETSKLRLEIEDLKEEAGDETTAYLIMAVIYNKLRALRKRYTYAVKTYYALQPLCEEWDQFKPLFNRIYTREVYRKYYEKRGVDCETYTLQTIDEDNSPNGTEVMDAIAEEVKDVPAEYILPFEIVASNINDKYNQMFSKQVESIRKTRKKNSSTINYIEKEYDIHGCENVLIGSK